MNDDKEKIDANRDGAAPFANDVAESGQILDAIRGRHLQMRPRWYFVLRGALAAAGAILVLICSLYFASLVVFLMRHNGAWFIPVFGAAGWLVLLLSLPWAFMTLIAVFVIILELLVRRYAFAYRRPLIISAFVLAAFVFAGGIVVGLTPLHGRIASLSSEHRLPFIARMYREIEAWHRDDVHQGTVERLTPTGFIFDEYDNDILNVVVSSRTRIEGGTLSAGDTVVIFGPEDTHSIQAVGVRKLFPADVE